MTDSFVGRVATGGFGAGCSIGSTVVGLVQFGGEADVIFSGAFGRVPTRFAGDGLQPVQKARGDSRRAADLGRMGQDHIVRSQQLRKIVRGEADAPFRQIEAEFMAHRPAQPGIDPRRRRPYAFDQPAKNDAVGFGQPRFELAVDVQLRARRFRPPHHAIGIGGLEHIGVVAELDHQAARLLLGKQVVERRRQCSALRFLEGNGDAVLIRRQRDQRFAMALRQFGEIERF